MAAELRSTSATESNSTVVSDLMKSRGRRVHARVALALLEALRDHDRPGEVLDDENVTETLPRRFGLSGVVRSQIYRYQQEAKRGRRIPEAEVTDLIRLVTRRPDSDEVFQEVGRSLTAVDGAPAWRRILPPKMVLGLARRRTQARLRALFGGALVKSAGPSFRLEAVHDVLLEGDPGGGACALVTGFSQAVLEAYEKVQARVTHPECRARGHLRCLWSIEEGTLSNEARRVPAPSCPDPN
ncbi:MAG: hypothetical protein WD804_01760 [Gemmatimonadota bacterium]